MCVCQQGKGCRVLLIVTLLGQLWVTGCCRVKHQQTGTRTPPSPADVRYLATLLAAQHSPTTTTHACLSHICLPCEPTMQAAEQSIPELPPTTTSLASPHRFSVGRWNALSLSLLQTKLAGRAAGRGVIGAQADRTGATRMGGRLIAWLWCDAVFIFFWCVFVLCICLVRCGLCQLAS